MKTRCPHCQTRYDVDPDALLEADGLARCFRCGTVFDVLAEEATAAGASDDGSGHPAVRLDQQSEVTTEETPPAELPFEIPEDLAPLQASTDDALDVRDTLYEKRSYRGLVYGFISALLLAGLTLQLAWQYREALLERYPQLEPLCRHLECRASVIHAPGLFSVLQRDIKPTANETGSLTLGAKIRNDADVAQHLPDIQLSLLDNNGAVLIRRRLAPRDYLFPAPSKDKLVAPGEVVTIALDFQDPGYLATGFIIDFL